MYEKGNTNYNSKKKKQINSIMIRFLKDTRNKNGEYVERNGKMAI